MQIHGILNVVSWGILFPIGVITARYLKNFEFGDPAWFYLHIFFQLSAYIIGVAGWGTGLKLGGESKGIVYHTHRNIGIALFCIATVQVKRNYTIFYLPKMCVSCKFISFSPIISKFRNHIWMKVTEAVRVFFFFASSSGHSQSRKLYICMFIFLSQSKIQINKMEESCV